MTFLVTLTYDSTLLLKMLVFLDRFAYILVEEPRSVWALDFES